MNQSIAKTLHLVSVEPKPETDEHVSPEPRPELNESVWGDPHAREARFHQIWPREWPRLLQVKVINHGGVASTLYPRRRKR